MIWSRVLTLALLLPLSSAHRTIADDAAAIRVARRAQNAAIARRDYAAVAQRWTEDITVRAGLGKALTGRQAYRDAFVADSAMTYTRTTDGVTVNSRWPLAYEHGHWVGTVRRSRGISLSGEYSAQWVRRGTEWLIRSELFVATSCTGEACAWPVSLP